MPASSGEYGLHSEHNGGRISILTLDGERLARWGDGPVHRSCHGTWVD
jgi:hypothetical protein